MSNRKPRGKRAKLQKGYTHETEGKVWLPYDFYVEHLEYYIKEVKDLREENAALKVSLEDRNGV